MLKVLKKRGRRGGRKKFSRVVYVRGTEANQPEDAGKPLERSEWGMKPSRVGGGKSGQEKKETSTGFGRRRL